MVAWQPVGMAMGAYDMCVRYLGQRQQFGAPLSAFQLSQDKLARMLGNIQVNLTYGTAPGVWGYSITGACQVVDSWSHSSYPIDMLFHLCNRGCS